MNDEPTFKRTLFIAWCVFLLIGLLAVTEIIARVRHFGPFRMRRIDLREPTMFKPDPILGWVPKAGKYLSPSYKPGGAPIQYTFFEDGSRATSGNASPAPYQIVLLGCSYIQGWAISDPETLGWKLQAAFPFLKAGNFGVGGYSTYQSLLCLRRLINRGEEPLVVFYGFNVFHEDRNIAPILWLKHLAEFSKRGHAAVPYCSLDQKGALVEHPPIRWPRIALRKYFAFPQFLTAIYCRLKTGENERARDKRKITEQLLLEMRDLARQHHAKFVVVMFPAPPEDVRAYAGFFRDHKIETLDASAVLTKEDLVPGEGHPNGRANSRWAGKIIFYLKNDLKAAP